jgi:hypothetical protein
MSIVAPRGHHAGATLTGEEKRRSQRVILRVPVILRITVAGKIVTVPAHTVSVNDHGAMLLCKRSFDAQIVVEMENDRTNEKIQCRVTRTPLENAEGYLVPVEFSKAAPQFWRISFPPRDWKPGEE